MDMARMASLMLALAVGLAGFQLGWDGGTPALAQAPAQAPAKADPTEAASIVTDPGYRLGAGDKIRLITFGEEQLTGEFQVSGAGTIALPLIGDIPAAGLTTATFQANVQAALKEYLKEPRVSVEVRTYRPFYILGEVNKPGEYPYTDRLTVLNAVATANGFTYRANQKQVLIKHLGENTERQVPLDGGTPVAPGDTIRIKERFF